MKMQMKVVVAGASALSLGLATQAFAMHDGGSASCDACHAMHSTSGGVPVVTGPFSVKGTDQSSACLVCHGGTTGNEYKILTTGTVNGSVPVQMTPGGDFSWTKVDCAGDATRNSKRGHNIIAADYSMAADSRAGMATAPGGTYPNANLHCSSCHDPHGSFRVDQAGNVAKTGNAISGSGSYGAPATATSAVGTYRLLAGKTYQPKSLINAGIANVFAADSPAAVVPSIYNSTIAGGVRVAYGSGMSEWCANCHSNFHAEGQSTGSFGVHPAGNGYKLGSAIANNYNLYVKTGTSTGSQSTSNLNLVPFESGNGQSTGDRTTLIALAASTAGPDATANVMCLSCHRAHASGHESMLRWNQANTFLTDTAGNYSEESGLLSAQVTAAYYNKPASDFGANQRSLCNKCHTKD